MFEVACSPATGGGNGVAGERDEGWKKGVVGLRVDDDDSPLNVPPLSAFNPPAQVFTDGF